jgi:hypothetical protein
MALKFTLKPLDIVKWFNNIQNLHFTITCYLLYKVISKFQNQNPKGEEQREDNVLLLKKLQPKLKSLEKAVEIVESLYF